MQNANTPILRQSGVAPPRAPAPAAQSIAGRAAPVTPRAVEETFTDLAFQGFIENSMAALRREGAHRGFAPRVVLLAFIARAAGELADDVLRAGGSEVGSRQMLHRLVTGVMTQRCDGGDSAAEAFLAEACEFLEEVGPTSFAHRVGAGATQRGAAGRG